MKRLRSNWSDFLVLVVLLCAFSAQGSGQIIELREYHGKEITCTLSGLMGFSEQCGAPDYYAYVFIGSILSIKPISETEWRLELLPEEMFRGAMTDRLSADTSQGACLPELHPGDRWLFYLARDEKTKSLYMSYGSPSRPASEAVEHIALLRRLSLMNKVGIVVGQATKKSKSDDISPLPNLTLVLKRVTDGSERTVQTDSEGRYEFDQVATGKYQLTVNKPPELWSWKGDGDVNVEAHSCTAVDFEFQRSARISGQLSKADGRPAQYVEIVAMKDGETRSARTDEQGHYEIGGLEPGKYLIGVGIDAEASSPQWKSRVYYPGVPSKDLAERIQFGDAENRTEINFTMK